jgi:hypothetical protein
LKRFPQQASRQATFQINQDTDVVTVTPPAGFVGWMAVRVAVQQTSATVPNANDLFDRQVIRIRILPAGTSPARVTADDDGDVDEDVVDEVFDELGAA